MPMPNAMTREDLVRAAEEANAETIRTQDELGALLHAAERRLEDAHKTISTLSKQREENRKCFVFAEAQVRGLRGLLEATEYALDESLKLQTHYAFLLNGYDGGKRREFPDIQSWLARLKELEPCPVCGGDCAGANPPVMNCPKEKQALTSA